MFSSGLKKINNRREVNCGWASGNWVELPSTGLLSNVINDCLIRGQVDFAEKRDFAKGTMEGAQTHQRIKLLL
jgi:hypothetical protein